MYPDTRYMHTISVQKHVDYSSPVMFVPLGTKTTTAPIPPVQKKIAQPTKSATKIASAATPAQSKKPPAVATPPQKKEEKKQATTMQSQTQPTSEIKKEVKQEIKKEVKETPHKIESVKKEEPQPLQQPVQQQASEKKISSPTMHVPENARISHNHREVEALRRSTQLQKELVQKWQPPVGVSSDCTCEISFFVTKQGTIENVLMIKKSGVIIFDISARQALFSMKMPHWTYGKPFTINFKK